MPMLPRRHALSALSVLVAGAIALPAMGQSEYRMDASGNWVQTAAPQPGTDEAVIAQAKKELAQDRPADAQNTINPWLEAHDRSNNPLLAHALIIRADALTAQGDEYEALYDYERAIKEFPATQSFITGIERELDIAVRYTGGLRRKFFGMRILPTSDIGEELLIRVQERMPGSRLAERAGIELADYYYRDHDLSLAVEAYDLFIQNYPNSQYKQRAMQRRIYATIARFKGPKYDGSALIDAKILTKRYVSLYPAEAEKAGLDDGLLTRLDESSGQEMLETANWYMRRGDEVSARLVLRRLVRDHSKTASAQKALEILQSKGWPIQLGAENKPRVSEPDFESGVTGAKTEELPGKPVDAQSEGKPDVPGDAKKEPGPGLPGERPPPVELNRRKPQVPPATDPAPPAAPAPSATPPTPPTPAPSEPAKP